MNYDLNETQLRFQEQMRELCQKEIAPKAELIDQADCSESKWVIRENIKKLGSIGYLKTLQEDGDLIKLMLAGEELAKACASTYFAVDLSASVCGRIISEVGTAAQKNAYLNGISDGSKIGGCCISQFEQADIIAEKNGSSWCLNGSCEWMGNAPIADFFIVCAKGVDAGEARMIFLVDAGSVGLTLTSAYDKIGAKGYPVSAARLERCCIPEDNLLGDTAQTGGLIERITDLQNWGMTVASLGVAVAGMEEVRCHYTEDGKTATQMQGFKVADMWVLTDIGRLLMLQAAWAVESSDYEAKVKASCASAFMIEAVSKIGNWVVELLGRDAYLNGSKAARLCRDVKYLLSCTTSEKYRDDIAERILSHVQ